MSGSQDEIPPPPPPPPSLSQTPTQQTPHTVSTIKLSILKKGEYDIWAMKMKHYLAHIDYPIWSFIHKWNGLVSITTDTQGQIKVLPPRSAEEIVAREKERKARTTLLIGHTRSHLAKFQSLQSAWCQVSLIMRTKPGVDSLSFNDLYNNLRVFENDVKGSTASSSSTQNVAFVSENTSSTNDVSTAYSVSNPSGQNSQCEQTSSYSLLANQSSCPQLDHEDLEQLDEYDLEEMDLKCRRRDAWNSGNKDGRRSGKQEDSKALVTIDGEGVDWTSHSEEEEDYALMACNSSGSDTEVTSCSNECKESYAKLKKLYDAQREQLSDASIEIKAYTQGLKKVEAQLVAHQQGQLWYEQKIKFMKIDLDDKTDVLTYHKKLLAEAMKEKEDLKAKVWSDLNTLEEYESDSEDEDYDFHEKRMAKQAELNNRLNRNSSQREIKPIWNNVQRVNNQNQFVPTALLTKTGKILVNTARASDYKEFNTVGGKREIAIKPSAGYNWRPQRYNWYNVSKYNGGSSLRTDSTYKSTRQTQSPSGCGHMTGNKAYLAEYQDFNGGPVAFGGSKGYITGKGKIKTGKLDFEDVCFVKELQHFNLFSVSQMCDKKNKVLFTDSECLVLSPEFKLPDENQVLLRIPRQNNMYSFNLENIVPSGGLACLIAKATIDESNKWHRRLGHVNFKNLNKLVKGNLVRGLPSKIFQNDHTCVACQKGKQHKASCKAKSVSSISQPLQLLHMDLFGPTSVRSLNHKTYCLVITDDFSRFSWVFFLRTKDETSGILKDFIRQIENQLNQKVKSIRCDNGTKFKNRDFIEFCGSKGIKREYSNVRTPQQNGVAERKNMTLIEAARTMLADSFLPNTFWAEAVSTACYVLNRVLVTKPQNKTPYELITGKIPIISYIRPFGCHVTILNTIDHLGKFDGKSDEGFLVGYSLQSKAFRVYNLETKRVEENLHITFLENKPNVAGKGPTWLFDLDYLTDSMNYQPVRSELTNMQDHFVLPIWSSYTSTVKSSKANNAGEEPTKHPNLKPVDKEDQVFLDELKRLKKQEQDANNAAEALRKEFAQDTEDLLLQAGAAKASSTNIVNTASTPVSTASPYGGLSFTDLTNTDQDDSEIPALEEIYDNPTAGIFTNASYDDEGVVADFTNLETVMNISHIPTSRINSIHPSTLILGDKKQSDQKFWSPCFYLPYRKKAIGTKWVYRNKKDGRGIMVRNKARIEAIRIFLAFASYMGFIVYQMDVKSAFLYGKINEEVYVSQPPGFIDPKYPQKVYKVVKALYGLHQAPRAWYATLSTFLLKNGYRRGTIDKTILVKKDKHDIILVQVYVDDIIFRSNKESGVIEFEALMKSRFQMSFYGRAHLLSWITSQTERRWFQVTPKTSHLSAIKRIFRKSHRKSRIKNVAAQGANCCGQVLWIQNQMLDYGFNFMNTKIYIDNESTICIVKNPVYHSKTKHIAIRYHFIRDAYEKKLIQVLKIHTDDNVADLLTKAFDVSRFQFLVVTIGMINP
ncbi:putative ribonuclease H-like domain-containing protein [Tanacetum coccineum]|uniref:Ribonuclease H-like domain-containing protein n=1 Tax=Tanacetum coccineum TaxID=301880 RepID=A0ABQ4XB31_9ASTR